jgi:hypothetical protein
MPNDESQRLSYVVVSAEHLRTLVGALKLIRDIAAEELPNARVGTGAEVALRHIKRKANEALLCHIKRNEKDHEARNA